MAIFNRTQSQSRNGALSPAEELIRKYQSACSNLLAVIVFTVINIVLLLSNSNSYFLFSAAVPRLLVDLGMYLCGKYPADYYEGNIADYEFFDNTFFIIMTGAAILILALYLLCWYMSRKKAKVGWLITALVLFAIDTLVFVGFYGISADMILDLLFHIWVAYYLVVGLSSYFKLKKMSAAAPVAEVPVTEVPVAETPVTEAPVAATTETVETAENAETTEDTETVE